MKIKIRILTLLAAAICLPVAATQVMFPLSAMFGGQTYTKTVRIDSVAPTITDGTNIYVGSFYVITPLPGVNPIVSMTPNNYVVTFQDSRTPWRISVPNTNVVMNALQLTSPSNSLPTFVYQPPAILVGGGATGTNTDANLLVSNSNGSSNNIITVNVNTSNIPTVAQVDTNGAGAFQARIATNGLAPTAFALPDNSTITNAAGTLKVIGGASGSTNSPTFQQSTNIAQVQAQTATNGLNSAAFASTNNFDANGAAAASTNGLNGLAAFVPVANLVTQNYQSTIVLYARPALQTMANPTYFSGNTNSYWQFGVNASLPDYTLDLFSNAVFTTRFMFTPEGPFVAANFGDSFSDPGTNALFKPTWATNAGNVFGGNGSGLTGVANGATATVFVNQLAKGGKGTQANPWWGMESANLTNPFTIYRWPSGWYSISNTINISPYYNNGGSGNGIASQCSHIGEDGTVIEFYGSGPCFNMSNTNGWDVGGRIENFTIDCTHAIRTNQTAFSVTAVNGGYGSPTLATVTCTNHGFHVGDFVTMTGATNVVSYPGTLQDYNGVRQIYSVPDTNHFTYQMASEWGDFNVVATCPNVMTITRASVCLLTRGILNYNFRNLKFANADLGMALLADDFCHVDNCTMQPSASPYTNIFTVYPMTGFYSDVRGLGTSIGGTASATMVYDADTVYNAQDYGFVMLGSQEDNFYSCLAAYSFGGILISGVYITTSESFFNCDFEGNSVWDYRIDGVNRCTMQGGYCGGGSFGSELAGSLFDFQDVFFNSGNLTLDPSAFYGHLGQCQLVQPSNFIDNGRGNVYENINWANGSYAPIMGISSQGGLQERPFSGNISSAPDIGNLGGLFTYNVSGNITLQNPVNGLDGNVFNVRFVHDATTNNYSITLGSAYVLEPGVAIPQFNAANQVAYMQARYYSTLGNWYVTGFGATNIASGSGIATNNGVGFSTTFYGTVIFTNPGTGISQTLGTNGLTLYNPNNTNGTTWNGPNDSWGFTNYNTHAWGIFTNGTLWLSSWFTANGITNSGNLVQQGSAQLNNALTVTGQTSLTGETNNGNTGISGALNVAGAVRFGGLGNSGGTSNVMVDGSGNVSLSPSSGGGGSGASVRPLHWALHSANPPQGGSVLYFNPAYGPSLILTGNPTNAPPWRVPVSANRMMTNISVLMASDSGSGYAFGTGTNYYLGLYTNSANTGTWGFSGYSLLCIGNGSQTFFINTNSFSWGTNTTMLLLGTTNSGILSPDIDFNADVY